MIKLTNINFQVRTYSAALFFLACHTSLDQAVLQNWNRARSILCTGCFSHSSQSFRRRKDQAVTTLRNGAERNGRILGGNHFRLSHLRYVPIAHAQLIMVSSFPGFPPRTRRAPYSQVNSSPMESLGRRCGNIVHWYRDDRTETVIVHQYNDEAAQVSVEQSPLSSILLSFRNVLF